MKRTRESIIEDHQVIWKRCGLGVFHAELHDNEIERLTHVSPKDYRDELERLYSLGRALPTRLRRVP